MGIEALAAGLADRYRIERELGQGGMAAVYLARDLKHDRHVAIKVLRPELTEALGAERFLREIETTASLRHPHILPLYDSGDADGLLYYVMPWVEGESLRVRLDRERQLPLPEALRIAREVAEALGVAHDRGIVHRDIKPENILLDGGHAVVADFGIARAISSAGEKLTQTGMAIGSPLYMSPEQASGGAVDGRTDLYALGCVLYEMLAGEPPYTGSSTQAILAKRLLEPVPRVSILRETVPPHLDLVLNRALAKAPADRFPTASDFLAALSAGDAAMPPPLSRRVARRPLARGVAAVAGVGAVAALVLLVPRSPPAAPAAGARTLAVLPFSWSGSDTANAYLAEGIADEVTMTLSQVPGLRLAGRSSAERFGRRSASPQEVGEALQVEAVLTGTVRRVGDQLRVSAELSDTRDGRLLWNESYTRPSVDIFRVQDDLARAIAGQLQVTLTASSGARGTRDPVAYDLYLKGKYHYRRRVTGLVASISLFEQALARDSAFAPAWAWLAQALTVSPYVLDRPMTGILPLAREAAERAVRLDPELADAHLARGFMLSELFDWEAAEAALRRAIALDPGLSEAYYRLGFLLVNTGRAEEAIPVLQQGKARDPLHFLIAAYLGWAQINLGLTEQGLAEEHRALALEPDNAAALSIMAHGYRAAGFPDSAVRVARRLVAVTRNPARLGVAALALGRSGAEEEARSLVRQIEATPEGTWTRWTGLALGYTGLGDVPRALNAAGQAARGDGDLFVSFATLLADDLPMSPGLEATLGRFNLDPARFGSRARGTRRRLRAPCGRPPSRRRLAVA